MSKTKIKIFGAANCGNVGDDLIAFVLQNYMQNYYGDKAEVSLIPQQQQGDLIKDADVLVIGGGGLIYDYDINNVRNYCDAIHYANSYRVPVYFMGMGVQHVFSDEAKRLYKEALPKVQAIATRGTYDTKFIVEDLEYNPAKVVTSRDLVFLYDDVVAPQPKAVRTSGKPVLALSLADWKLGKSYQNIKPGLAAEYKKYRDYLNQNLPLLKEKFDVKVVCQASEDAEISAYLASRLDTEVITFPSVERSGELVELYRLADYVVTNRYHGLIAAIVANTPVVGVSFASHKSQRLIEDSFPSLANQFYTVDQFVTGDLAVKLTHDDFLATLRAASKREYRACLREVRKHQQILTLIAADIAKQ